MILKADAFFRYTGKNVFLVDSVAIEDFTKMKFAHSWKAYYVIKDYLVLIDDYVVYFYDFDGFFISCYPLESIYFFIEFSNLLLQFHWSIFLKKQTSLLPTTTPFFLKE